MKLLSESAKGGDGSPGWETGSEKRAGTQSSRPSWGGDAAHEPTWLLAQLGGHEAGSYAVRGVGEGERHGRVGRGGSVAHISAGEHVHGGPEAAVRGGRLGHGHGQLVLV